AAEDAENPSIAVVGELNATMNGIFRIEKTDEPFAQDGADGNAVGDPVMIDDASVVEAVAAEDEGTEGRLGRIIEAAVELLGDVIFKGSAGGDDAHAVEAHLAVEAFEIKSAAIDMDAAEAQVVERIVPGLLERGRAGNAFDFENLRGVVGMHRIPLPGQALKDVDGSFNHDRRN